MYGFHNLMRVRMWVFGFRGNHFHLDVICLRISSPHAVCCLLKFLFGKEKKSEAEVEGTSTLMSRVGHFDLETSGLKPHLKLREAH